MIDLDEHEGSYLAICKHYKAVYETGEITDNSEKAKEVIVFAINPFPQRKNLQQFHDYKHLD